MKKRAAAKKPAARKSAAKKSTKSSAKAETPAPRRVEERATAGAKATAGGKYTPTPIQGIGWAPFRYPA